MDRAVLDVLASLELDVFQQSLEQLGVRSCMDVTYLMDEDLKQIGLNLVQVRKLQFHIGKTTQEHSKVQPQLQPCQYQKGKALGQRQSYLGGAQVLRADSVDIPPVLVKQMIGEQLFPMISKIEPINAAKITGMFLEMDNKELYILLDSEQQLKNKVDEALRVLQRAQMGEWCLSSMLACWWDTQAENNEKHLVGAACPSVIVPHQPPANYFCCKFRWRLQSCDPSICASQGAFWAGEAES